MGSDRGGGWDYPVRILFIIAISVYFILFFTQRPQVMGTARKSEIKKIKECVHQIFTVVFLGSRVSLLLQCMVEFFN